MSTEKENPGLIQLASMTQEQARAMFERIRWAEGRACPHCGTVDESTLLKMKNRPGIYQCRACRKQFSVTTGTVMHGTHIDLTRWAVAFYLVASAKKGVSSLQLKRQLGLGSYKSAWFLTHRIRKAMENDDTFSMLGTNGGTVEADEAYFGGKPRRGIDKNSVRGRGTKKIPVVALVERDGRARAATMKKLDGKAVREYIRDNADLTGTLMTDEANLYHSVGPEFEGGHHATKHSLHRFSRHETQPDGSDLHVHSNTVESFFSLLKRGHYGAFHKWGSQHMDRYCHEFAFRWSHRKEDDYTRTVAAIKGADGVRLTYHELPATGTFC